MLFERLLEPFKIDGDLVGLTAVAFLALVEDDLGGSHQTEGSLVLHLELSLYAFCLFFWVHEMLTQQFSFVLSVCQNGVIAEIGVTSLLGDFVVGFERFLVF